MQRKTCKLTKNSENKTAQTQVPNIVLANDHTERRSSGEFPAFPEKL